MRVYQFKDVSVRPKLQAIHTVFSFMKALNFDQSAATAAAAMKLAQKVDNLYNSTAYCEF